MTDVNVLEENILLTVAPIAADNISILEQPDTAIEIAGTETIIVVTDVVANNLEILQPEIKVLEVNVYGSIISTTTPDSFETLSKNLKAWNAMLLYSSGVLISITYTMGAATILKTFNYSAGILTSIVLSGDVPSGVSLTKTFAYSSGNLTTIIYS